MILESKILFNFVFIFFIKPNIINYNFKNYDAYLQKILNRVINLTF
jgi:hypothetical protein